MFDRGIINKAQAHKMVLYGIFKSMLLTTKLFLSFPVVCLSVCLSEAMSRPTNLINAISHTWVEGSIAKLAMVIPYEE